MTETEKYSESIEITAMDKSFPGKILLVKKGCLAIEFSNDIIDPIKLATGTNLDYRIVIDGSICTFVSTVIGFRTNKSRTIAVLSPPRAVDETEKRKYFRMETSTKIDYCLLPLKRDNLSLSEIPHIFFQELNASTTVDISEGGTKIRTREEFMKDQYGLLALYIPERTIVLGRAIRCEQNAHRGFDTAFEYSDITDSIKKKISDFIIEKSVGIKE